MLFQDVVYTILQLLLFACRHLAVVLVDISQDFPQAYLYLRVQL